MSLNGQNVDVIVKFGGSAVTNKSKLETLRKQQLAAAAQCIRSCKDAGLTCIVVHGAGSYGHHQAKQYGINLGWAASDSEEDKKWKMSGFCITSLSVKKLNQIVTESLIEAGVQAISCSPSSSWGVDNRMPLSWPSEIVSGFLQEGVVPVLHGDCCLDRSLGCCILSGDTIIKTLCSYFTVKRVVFLTDVAGVYDKPPEEPGAQLLKTISVLQDGTIQGSISTSQSHQDVTGGIVLKLKTAVDIVVHSKGKCPVYVCAVDSPDAALVCCGTQHSKDLIATSICLALDE